MKQQGKKQLITIKTKPHSYFFDQFYKKLKQQNCVIDSLTSLCGGFVNKLCKNKSTPLPLFFANIEAMESISKNKPLLKKIFESFNTRQLGRQILILNKVRIDACELYCSFLLLSKASYETFLKTIIDIFGFQSQGRITRNQFFFFLDSFYRMLPKILITKECQKPSSENNLRLEYQNINQFVEKLFQGNRTEIERNQIYQLLIKMVPELNKFLKYLQKKCTTAAELSRIQALNKIKFETQIRNCLSDIVLKVHMELQKKNKPTEMLLT